MSDAFHQHIRNDGFEGLLEQMIAYAETQAKLNQSLGDHQQWIFWVRSWANLQRASDAIAFPINDDECLSMWQEHQEEYASAEVDFEFP